MGGKGRLGRGLRGRGCAGMVEKIGFAAAGPGGMRSET